MDKCKSVITLYICPICGTDNFDSSFIDGDGKLHCDICFNISDLYDCESYKEDCLLCDLHNGCPFKSEENYILPCH